MAATIATAWMRRLPTSSLRFVHGGSQRRELSGSFRASQQQAQRHQPSLPSGGGGVVVVRRFLSSTWPTSKQQGIVSASGKQQQHQYHASFSTVTATATEQNATKEAEKSAAVDPRTLRPPGYTKPQILVTRDGREMALFKLPPRSQRAKLKPHIVARRLANMRTYVGQEKNIRHSPWRLNLICQFVAGMTVPEALTQLQFSKKSKAPLVQRVLKRTANIADMQDGLRPSQLEVAECFATRGTPLKRIKYMARGRFGRMERKHAHMRVVLREIDFPLRIYQAPNQNQKRKWYQRQVAAEAEGARAAAEREEMRRLEREAAAAAAAAAETK